MRRTSVPSRCHLDLVRVCLRIGDELRNGFCGNRGVDQHDERLARDRGDWRDVAQKIVIEIAVDRRIDGVRRPDQEERISVGRRVHDGLGGDVAGGAGPVLDDHRLTQPPGQPLPHQAPEDVVGAAGRKADDEVDRTSRI